MVSPSRPSRVITEGQETSWQPFPETEGASRLGHKEEKASLINRVLTTKGNDMSTQRSTGRIWLAILGTWAILIGGTMCGRRLTAQGDTPVIDVVRARRFVLVNAQGGAVGQLETDENGGARFVLKASLDAQTVMLTASPMSISLKDPTGETALSANRITLSHADPEQEHRRHAWVAAHPNAAAGKGTPAEVLEFGSLVDPVGIAIQLVNNAGAVSVYGPTGQLSGASIATRLSGRMTVNDEQGRPAAELRGNRGN